MSNNPEKKHDLIYKVGKSENFVLRNQNKGLCIWKKKDLLKNQASQYRLGKFSIKEQK